MSMITKQELEKLIKNKSHYSLIDVRTPDETKGNLIETAKNVQLQEFQSAFQLDSSEFEKKYGFKKPEKDEHVILYCRSGARAGTAQDIATKLGYKK